MQSQWSSPDLISNHVANAMAFLIRNNNHKICFLFEEIFQSQRQKISYKSHFMHNQIEFFFFSAMFFLLLLHISKPIQLVMCVRNTTAIIIGDEQSKRKCAQCNKQLNSFNWKSPSFTTSNNFIWHSLKRAQENGRTWER